MDILELFPASYGESRQRFREILPDLKKMWPSAQLHKCPLSDFPEITIDWIMAEGNTKTEKMLIFTIGEHGVEGYVGSAMLQYFYQNYLPQLDPDTTGLTLVHMINPWGMKFGRRTNANNVDLNRNFVWDINKIDLAFNPDYKEINTFINPQKPVKNLLWAKFVFSIQYLYHLVKMGKTSFWDAKILGQYTHPQGIHYGGTYIQEEVQLIQSLYKQAFDKCGIILHLDMHTGHGPRTQMTLVNSVLEPKSSAEFVDEIGYPLVAAMNSDEFYKVRGDMIDYIYALRNNQFPDAELYATSFEFGTFGESDGYKIRSLRAMIHENQCFWYGSSTKGIEEKVQLEFLELFSPSEIKWRIKAMADADQAFQGILRMVDFV